MIELLAGWFITGAATAAYVGIVAHLAPRAPRPPRHARPRDWNGPTNRAPSPPVAQIMPEGLEAWPLDIGDGRLSALNREVLRRRFRVMWHEDQGRPVV